MRMLECERLTLAILRCCFLFMFLCSVVDTKRKRSVQSDFFSTHIRTRSGHLNGDDSTSSSYHYAENYDVPLDLLKQKGGIGPIKKSWFLLGSVYLAQNLRHIIAANGAYDLGYDYEQIGVCDGHVAGPNLANITQSFRYFACPTDEEQAARLANVRSFRDTGSNDLELFCCRSPPDQRCCGRETFYKMYGKVRNRSSLAVKLVVALSGIVSALLFSGCLCLIICLCIVMPHKRRQQQQQLLLQRSRPMMYGGVNTPLLGQQQQQQQEYASSNGAQPPYPMQPQPLYPQQQQQQQQPSYPTQSLGHLPPPYSHGNEKESPSNARD